MSRKPLGLDDARRVVVPPESELDAALNEAEAGEGFVELVHGDARHHVVAISGPVEDPELVYRRFFAARAQAFRDRQPPLGMTTAQLVREARGEHANS